jgi:hypothetical protein
LLDRRPLLLVEPACDSGNVVLLWDAQRSDVLFGEDIANTDKHRGDARFELSESRLQGFNELKFVSDDVLLSMLQHLPVEWEWLVR